MSPQAKKITLASAAVVLGWLSAFIVAVWAASADNAQSSAKIEQNVRASQDHEIRLRVLEAQMGTIAADVRWIAETVRRIELMLNPRPTP